MKYLEPRYSACHSTQKTCLMSAEPLHIKAKIPLCIAVRAIQLLEQDFSLPRESLEGATYPTEQLIVAYLLPIALAQIASISPLLHLSVPGKRIQ